MPSLLDIPIDIIELLLEELVLQEERKTIKSLALCCKALLPLCRRHIFSSIKVMMPPDDDDTSFLEELAFFFESNSVVSSLVKHLKLWTIDNIPSHTVLRIVRSLHRIHTFMLESIDEDYWERIPEEMKNAVMHVLSLPTLSNLSIRDINNFPASAFTACFNILTLDLDFTTLDSNFTCNHEQKNIPSVRSFSMLSSIRHNTNILMGGDSSPRLIDFTNLQDLTIGSRKKRDLIAAMKVVTAGRHSIKSFTLHCGKGLTHEGVATSIQDSGVSKP